MLHGIRLAMQSENGGKIDGTVEADKTYIGRESAQHARRKETRRHVCYGRSIAGKGAVMALLERHGKEASSKVRLRARWSAQFEYFPPTITKFGFKFPAGVVVILVGTRPVEEASIPGIDLTRP